MTNKVELLNSLEFKNSQISLHETNTNLIYGYASVFGVVDAQQDVVMPGAFTASLLEHLSRKKVALLWQHQSDKPIGVIEQLLEDSYGLYVKAQILKDVHYGREALSLIKSKAICGLSIGYTPTKFHYRVDNIRIIEEISLWEVSVVTFPANHQALIMRLEAECMKSQELLRKLSKAMEALGYKIK